MYIIMLILFFIVKVIPVMFLVLYCIWVFQVNNANNENLCKAANNGRTPDICQAKMATCPPKSDSGQTKDRVL